MIDPGARNLPEVPDQITVALRTNLQSLARPVESDDVRRPFERAKHDHDPTVFFQVGDRLHAASSQVEIAYSVAVDDPKSVDPLGRAV